MYLKVCFILILKCLTLNFLFGQKTDFGSIATQQLKEQCNICKKNIIQTGYKADHIDQLYHQLHIATINATGDSIISISTELKLLLDGQQEEKISYFSPFYNFYGLQLNILKLHEEALEAFNKSLHFVQDSTTKGGILNNLATLYMFGERKNYNKALNYLLKAEVLIQKVKYLPLLSKISKNQALCYLHTERYNKSEKAYRLAISIETTLNDSMGLVYSYMNLANLYYEQYLDDKAIPLFKKALALAKEVGHLPTLLFTQQNMATIHENAGEYKKALLQYKAYQTTKDSINNIDKVRDLSIAEQTRLTEQREQRNKEVKLQQILFTSIGSAILAILLLIGYQYRNSLKKNKIIATQKQKVDELNTIKDELLSVLGHDLRTPMQHLISVFDRSFKVLKKGDDKKLLKLLQHGNLAVSQTSILLDNVLQWVTQQNKQGYFKKETVALFPLIQQIQGTFLPITQMRAIELVNEVDAENTVLADRNSLKIIIRNLVDNAIKFSAPNGQIRITASTKEDGRQGIHIQDTGVGMSAEIQAKILSTSAATVDTSGRKSTGLGLRICKEFIQRHDGELTIESVEGEGSRFSVWLPLG